MKKLVFSAALTLAFASVSNAQGQKCTAGNYRFLENTLSAARANDALPEELREKASMVLGILAEEMGPSCGVIHGFAGDIYFIENATLKANVNYFGSSLNQISLERKAFD